jgi:hypothetical protein
MAMLGGLTMSGTPMQQVSDGAAPAPAGGYASYAEQMQDQNYDANGVATNPFGYVSGTNTQAQQTPGYANIGAALAPTVAGGSSGTTGSGTASGIPTAAQVANTAPAPVQDFGAIPQVAPTYANATTVNPQQSQQYLNQAEGLEAQALAPTFQQQQMQLQDSDAARGISNSGAAGYLQGNLQGQQASALASADAPMVAQGYSYSQSDIAANQNAQNTANLTNAAASNAAANTNAGYYASAVGTNAANYNNYLSALNAQGDTQSNALLSAYLNSFGANTGVTSAINTSEAGASNVFGSTYGAAQQNENQELTDAGLALGG